MYVVLSKMGFCPLCIKWIHGCLSSVSYFFNINAVQSGYICLSRAIRQGHPPFSYLFVFCAEGLSNLINNAVDNNKLTRVKISSRNIPPYLIYFLLPTLGSFAKLSKTYNAMSKPLANRSILANLLSFSARIPVLEMWRM